MSAKHQSDLLMEQARWTLLGIPGCRRARQRLLDQLTEVAVTEIQILLTGSESLNDKGQYAEFIHRQSHRAKAGFVTVNCSAIRDEFFENQLFGPVVDLVVANQKGLDSPVVAAEGGTLFLNEVDALSLPCQMKLARFIQDKEYRQLGGTHLCRANVRLVAAANSGPAALQTQRVCRDLYLRFNVVSVKLSPFWESIADIRCLLAKLATRIGNCLVRLRLLRSRRQRLCAQS